MMMLAGKRASPVLRVLVRSRCRAGDFGAVSCEVRVGGAGVQSRPSSGKQVSRQG